MLQLVIDKLSILATLCRHPATGAVMKPMRPASLLSGSWSGVSHSLLPRKAMYGSGGDHSVSK